jgi:hypothetical protein
MNTVARLKHQRPGQSMDYQGRSGAPGEVPAHMVDVSLVLPEVAVHPLKRIHLQQQCTVSASSLWHSILVQQCILSASKLWHSL